MAGIYGNSKYKTQVGHPGQCGRKGCKATPTYRIGLGRFVVQVLACTEHVVWAVKLDELSQNTGEALGFHYGHPGIHGSLDIKQVWITQTMARVASGRYSSEYLTRDESPRISGLWPDAEGNYP